MISSLKLEGIYDLESLIMAQSYQCNHIALDFRPEVEVFITQDKALELLKSLSQKKLPKISLQFDEEKDFVIQQLTYEILTHHSHLAEYVVFDVLDQRPQLFWDQFQRPYWRELCSNLDTSQLLSPWCYGVVVDTHVYGEAILMEQLIGAFEELKSKKTHSQFNIIVRWHGELELLDWVQNCSSKICLAINLLDYQKTFRQVDRQLLADHLDYLSNKV